MKRIHFDTNRLKSLFFIAVAFAKLVVQNRNRTGPFNPFGRRQGLIEFKLVRIALTLALCAVSGGCDIEAAEEGFFGIGLPKLKIPVITDTINKIPNPLGLGNASSEAWNPTNVVMPVLTGDFEADTKAMKEAPEKDRSAWQYRMALQQLRKGNYQAAKVLLDGALTLVEASYGPVRNAGKAGSLFSREEVKPFIGEPYERSMAYYYRGMLYWMSNNPESARADFKMAQFEDSLEDKNPKKKFGSDYVSFDYLYGLASFQLGDAIWEEWYRMSLTHTNGQEAFKAPPPYDKSNNVVAFIEFGRGPTKFAGGKHNRELLFTPGETGVERVRLVCGVLTNEASAYDNLTFQAITRGGRVMDKILKNKSQFKTASGVVGDAALLGSIGAAAAGADSNVQYIMIGISAASYLASFFTKPDCDTRCWDNLPQCLSVASWPLPPGSHSVTVEFLDKTGNAIRSRVVPFDVKPAPQSTVLFISELTN